MFNKINLRALVWGALFIVLIPLTMSAQKKPDFAYPKTVIKESQAKLEQALNDNDDKAALRSVADIVLAQNAISPDSTSSSLELIDNTIGAMQERKRPVAVALLELIEARYLYDTYESEEYIYNERHLPKDAPAPEDPAQWDKDIYQQKIYALIDKVLSCKQELLKQKLNEWKGLVEQGKYTDIYYPTLYDFVVCVVDDIYRGFDDQAKIKPLLTDLVSVHSTAYAPKISAQIALADADEEEVDVLWPLYEQYKDKTEFSGDILIAIKNRVSNSDKKKLWDAVTWNLNTYKSFIKNKDLKSILIDLGDKILNVRIDAIARIDKPSKIAIESSNVEMGKICVYEISQDAAVKSMSYDFTPTPSQKPVHVVPFSLPDSIPFSKDFSVEYTFPKPGAYIIVPVIGDVQPTERKTYDIIRVTDLTLASLNDSITVLQALNLNDGAPVQDAAIYKSAYREKIKKIGETDTQGRLFMPKEEDSSYTVTAVKDGSISCPLSVYSWHSRRGDNARGVVEIFLDLPLYHPGDTLNFGAIAYQQGRPSSVLKDRLLLVTLYDAQRDTISTMRCKTDKFGRISGKFELPKDRLTGHYSLSCQSVQDKRNIYGNARFEVSDYKLPTYALTLDKAEVTTAKDVVIRGSAVSYNGMPLAGANIELTVMAAERFCWFFRHNDTPIYNIEASTDADGRFSITIPNSVFVASKYLDGYFTANVKAVSASGEAREASTSFMLKPAYKLSTNMPDVVDISKGLTLKVDATDYNGDKVALPLRYTFTPDTVNSALGEKLAEISGDITSGTEKAITLKPGRWKVKIEGANRDECEPLRFDIVAWSFASETSPVTDILWTPETNITAEKDLVSIPVFADKPTHIIYLLQDETGRFIEDKIIPVKSGRTMLSVPVTKGTDLSNVTLLAVADYRSSKIDITIRDKRREKKLELQAETFRDRISPSTKETLTLRLKAKNAQIPAAAMLRVFNKAVNAIAPSSWNFRVANLGPNWVNWDGARTSYNISEAVSQYQRTDYTNVREPDFNTYGQGWRANYRLVNDFVVESRGMMLASAPSMSSADEMPEMDGGTNSALKMGVGSLKYAEVEEESEEAAPQEAEKFEFRDAEVPLAYFAPTLVSKADGTLEATFDVPNANATWLLQSIAWTADPLVSASWSAEAIASKPIMVQPNLPRFLRQGDVAVVNITVFNNTDKAQSVSADVELFEPVSEKILSAKSVPVTIPASESAVVSYTIDTRLDGLKDVANIGFRVKGHCSNGFADGEQSLLPVLEPVGRVYESEPFWIAPATREFTRQLDGKDSKDREVSVTVNDNPVASVLSALPGMINTPVFSACSAAHAIFSVTIAQKLLKENPDLLLHGAPEWTLDKGKLLKSPFLNEAKEDTRRMELLNLLADGKEGASKAKGIIADAIKLLKTLEKQGGGWSWSPCGTEMSAWATMNNLALMGRMRQLGADQCLDKDAKETLYGMIETALKALDKEIYKDYMKYPNGNYMLYTLTRDFWTDIYPASLDAEKVMSATVQQIIGRWRDLDNPQKAMCAQILENHSYRNVAKEILASLEEHSESTPEKGMWWPMVVHRNSPTSVIGNTSIILDAWYQVEPSADAVDGIRQWMILQKRTQDWGTSATTTDAIASILTSSQRWMKAPDKDATNVNLADNVLTITRNGESDVPLFGAVSTTYTPAPGTVVPASPCEGIVSIEKQILRVNPDGSTSENMQLKVGDKVRVLVTLGVKQAVDYVMIRDNRPACLEPVDLLSSNQYMQGVLYYRESRDDATILSFYSLPVGTYQITYDAYVNNAGTYTVPAAQLNSEYAPEVVAHSTAGTLLEVSKEK